jgi:protein-L-isoaspartate(D-aspartate) O-methyltransferase
LSQLKVGGRLVVILGQAPSMKAQRITRTGEAGYDTVTLFETVVPPLLDAVAPSAFRF